MGTFGSGLSPTARSVRGTLVDISILDNHSSAPRGNCSTCCTEGIAAQDKAAERPGEGGLTELAREGRLLVGVARKDVGRINLAHSQKRPTVSHQEVKDAPREGTPSTD